MKICFIASADSIHSRKWIDYFLKKGYQIYLISLEKPQADFDKRINLYLGSIFNLFRFVNLIREIKPDIVHAHYAGFNGFIAALSGVHPFVLTAWGSDILVAGQSFPKGLLVKLILKKADLITCDAGHLRKAMIKMGVTPEKIEIIRFGVDTERFFPGSKDRELEKKLDISGCSTVISLRNFEPVYDLETLLRAVPLVLREFPQTKFILMGRGSRKEELKGLAGKLNIKDSVRFPERVLNDEISRYLRTADIYVSTSLSDAGIASSTAEAMACQLPVIVTDTGENRRWIKDGENGFVIPVKSPKILAEKIISLLRKPELRQRFGMAGREIIKEKNDYHTEMAKMEKIYYEIKK